MIENNGTHAMLDPLDPPGTEGRRWRCRRCGAVGSPRDLLNGRPPCPESSSVSDEELLAVLSEQGSGEQS